VIPHLYHTPEDPEHLANIAMFRRIEARFPWIGFRQPNPIKAPWHVTGRIGRADISFWPHIGKAAIPNHRSVVGEEAILRMIDEAMIEFAMDEVLDDPLTDEEDKW